MHSTPKPTAPATPLIVDYGIAHANDFYTLAELVKAQINKGFQPCINSGVTQMQHGQELVFVQVMVKYATAKTIISKKITIKNGTHPKRR